MAGARHEVNRAAVIASAMEVMFGRRIINNVFRSNLVEAMVHLALSPDWKWVSEDWQMCDFQHVDGTRLEVKQSAARQSWHLPNSQPSKPSFDIAARSGYWDKGATWVSSPGRNAEIYIFGFHPLVGDEADHADPNQWEFHTTLASRLPLPPRRSISLTGLSDIASKASFQSLGNVIDQIHEQHKNCAVERALVQE